MTIEDAINAFYAGYRVVCEKSLHATETPNPWCRHHWRTLFCNGEKDVLECSYCGRQAVAKCDFDEEFA